MAIRAGWPPLNILPCFPLVTLNGSASDVSFRWDFVNVVFAISMLCVDLHLPSFYKPPSLLNKSFKILFRF